METIPQNTLAESKLCMTFDQGYRKMKFVQTMTEKGFNVLTITTTVSSLHPLIDMADVDTLKTKWVSTNVTQSEID